MLFCYSVYDRKALQYHPPFYASTDGSAIRTFSDVVNDINTTVGRHPADYVLFCVGSYGDQKGELMPVSPLRHIIDATALLHVQPVLPLQNGKDELAERV